MNGTRDEVLCLCDIIYMSRCLFPITMAGIGSIDVTHPLSSLATTILGSSRERASVDGIKRENDRGDVANYVIRRLSEVKPPFGS
jgi:hypothetical protein